MTTTITPDTTDSTEVSTTDGELRAERPPINEAIIEMAGQLHDAAAIVRERASGLEKAGEKRRNMKLCAQLEAASRLLVRGARLEEPRVLSSFGWLAKAAAQGGELSVIDARIKTMSERIVALHRWRGHIGSLPVDERT